MRGSKNAGELDTFGPLPPLWRNSNFACVRENVNLPACFRSSTTTTLDSSATSAKLKQHKQTAESKERRPSRTAPAGGITVTVSGENGRRRWPSY